MTPPHTVEHGNGWKDEGSHFEERNVSVRIHRFVLVYVLVRVTFLMEDLPHISHVHTSEQLLQKV
jgi:hypothetical protein